MRLPLLMILISALAGSAPVLARAQAAPEISVFASAPMTPQHIVVPPRWIKVPTSDNLALSWPAGVGAEGGEANLSCLVTVHGDLEKCEVVSERPVGRGVGKAALELPDAATRIT